MKSLDLGPFGRGVSSGELGVSQGGRILIRSRDVVGYTVGGCVGGEGGGISVWRWVCV